MIGASAAISGTMAAAMRFAFQRGGPLALLGRADESAYRVPAIPLRDVLSDARVLLFLVVWFGINILFGLGSLPITGSEPIGRLAGPYRRISCRIVVVFLVRSASRIFRKSTTLLQRRKVNEVCGSAHTFRLDGTGVAAGSLTMPGHARRIDRGVCLRA